MLENKKGFTLAEVLITLGIIGIIAAMTLPSIVHRIKVKEYETRFKTAYSLVFQAVQLMGNEDPQLWQSYCAKNSNADVTSNRDNDFSFINDFSKQFQVLNAYAKPTHRLTELGYKQKSFYQTGRPQSAFNEDSHNNGAFIAKNGMIVFSSGCWWANSLDFTIDTNGHKGPNKFGYDVFYFQIAKNNQLLPSSINSSFGELESQEAACCDFINNAACNVYRDNGSACSRFALMDTFPNDSKKTYWKNLPTP